MPTRLTATVVRDPGRGYTRLPVEPQRHLVVLVDEHPDGLRLGLFGAVVARHSAVVPRRAGDLEAVADKLRQGWERRLVRFQELDEYGYPSGPFPFADHVDLSGHAPEHLDAALVRLQELGWQLLSCLTDGAGKTEKALLDVLGREGLRISFESRALHLPWAMMCLGTERDEPSFELFLGYRHEIEQTGCLNEPHDPPPPQAPGERPGAGLYADASLAPQAAAEVAALLRGSTRLRTGSRGGELFAALRGEGHNDAFLYFWCHGFFETAPHGTGRPRLVIRLHPQDESIDAAEFGAALRRSRPGRLTRSPLVLLNACSTGRPADGDVHHLGRALVEKGAGGVLAPQIEVPVPFAARYGLRFVRRYLAGESAGGIARSLAREFADRHRNPLGLAYTFLYGLDCRLAVPAAGHPGGVPGPADGGRGAARIIPPATGEDAEKGEPVP